MQWDQMMNWIPKGFARTTAFLIRSTENATAISKMVEADIVLLNFSLNNEVP